MKLNLLFVAILIVANHFAAATANGNHGADDNGDTGPESTLALDQTGNSGTIPQSVGNNSGDVSGGGGIDSNGPDRSIGEMFYKWRNEISGLLLIVLFYLLFQKLKAR